MGLQNVILTTLLGLFLLIPSEKRKQSNTKKLFRVNPKLEVEQSNLSFDISSSSQAIKELSIFMSYLVSLQVTVIMLR